MLKAPSFPAEAEAVANEIVSVLTDIPEPERRFSDFAILYRAHSHREEFIAALERRQIPYKVVSGAGLFKKEEIKDICASLKCAAGREDGVARHRALSLADLSIPPSGLRALSRWMSDEELDLSGALGRIDECAGIEDESCERIRKALDYLVGLKALAHEKTASEVCQCNRVSRSPPCPACRDCR